MVGLLIFLVEPTQVDTLIPLFVFEKFDADFEPLDHSFQFWDQLVCGIDSLGQRHGRIAELALKGQKQVVRFLCAVRQRDAAFFFAEQNRIGCFLVVPFATHVMFAMDVDEIRHVHHSELVSDVEDPALPGFVVDRVDCDRLQAVVVVDRVSAERFELVKEHRRPIGTFAAKFCVVVQQVQCRLHLELSVIVFCGGNQERLEGRKVVSDPLHRGRHRAELFDFGEQEIDRHRQLCCRQDFLAKIAQQILNRFVSRHSFEESFKKIRLFDVLFF